jgi:lysophospholipase L1-like esterase
MRSVIILIISLGLMGCEMTAGISDIDPGCDHALPEDTEREDVLIIGDSISWGYLPTVQENLPDYDVVHNPCNARSSRNGVLNIDLWLSKRDHWKLVTFNHGLWDARKSVGMTRELYAANLREIATKILAKSDHVIFLTTTVIPENEPTRRVGFEDELNEVAREVMGELGIPVYDLNAVSRGIPDSQRFNGEYRNDVHYTEEGYRILGDFVTDAIRDAL